MLGQFLKSILIFWTATFPVWLLYRAAINVYKKRRSESVSFKKEMLLSLFFLYVVFALAITIIPLPFTEFRNSKASGINLIPIVNTTREFAATLTPQTSYLTPRFLQNIVGNVILFIPLGIFLPIISPKFRTLKGLMIFAASCSLTIELIQFISTFFGSYRSVDIDDVILNSLGAFIGFVIYGKILVRIFRVSKASLENNV